MGGAALVFDNLGRCRFHRQWAEEMLPEVMGSLYGLRESHVEATRLTACQIASRDASVFWESARDPDEAALDFWFESLNGIHESLREG